MSSCSRPGDTGISRQSVLTITESGVAEKANHALPLPVESRFAPGIPDTLTGPPLVATVTVTSGGTGHREANAAVGDGTGGGGQAEAAAGH
jgi:hypothetical protein